MKPLFTVPKPKQALLEIREELGLTQKELADLAGVEEVSICRIENNKGVGVDTYHRVRICVGKDFICEVDGTRQEEEDVTNKNKIQALRAIAKRDRVENRSKFKR